MLRMARTAQKDREELACEQSQATWPLAQMEEEHRQLVVVLY